VLGTRPTAGDTAAAATAVDAPPPPAEPPDTCVSAEPPSIAPGPPHAVAEPPGTAADQSGAVAEPPGTAADPSGAVADSRPDPRAPRNRSACAAPRLTSPAGHRPRTAGHRRRTAGHRPRTAGTAAEPSGTAAEPPSAAAEPPGAVAESVAAARPPRVAGLALPVAFQSLRHPNYRLLWFGTVISSSGDWMDQIALNWLVYQLSGSAVHLALLNLARLAPIFVFTLVGGVIADRAERRRLLFITQAVAMLLALMLATLTVTGLVQIWMVIVIAVGRGIVLSFNQPARQSLISELVPREDLKNAIALNSATLNLTRVLGPTIGGILIATVGVAGAFYLNAITFLAVLYALTLMRFPDRTPRQAKASLLADLAGGLSYLNQRPTLRTLVLLALLPMVFGMPYMTMLTVFASDVLQVGGGGLGLLTACSGIGAVGGALWVAGNAHRLRLGRLMFFGLIGFGATLVVFSLSPWFWVSVVALVAVGAAQQIYMASNNALLQTHVEEEFRGRIVSTLFLNRSMVPLGTVLASIGTTLVGVQATSAVMAAGLLVLALAVSRLAPAARDLE
jgi:MFS transporter, DHA1 family, staphyloferrin A biosynthesis exporter